MSILFYQAGGFFGYSIGDVLNRWADLGVFAYVLPFLMIFALVYGILFAGLDEFWQSFIPNRCSNIYDFLFDVLGVCFGSMLILSTVKKHD